MSFEFLHGLKNGFNHFRNGFSSIYRHGQRHDQNPYSKIGGRYFINLFDKNHNGTIDRGDFQRQGYSIFDRNHDGKIDGRDYKHFGHYPVDRNHNGRIDRGDFGVFGRPDARKFH